jgi:hypothetical protein
LRTKYTSDGISLVVAADSIRRWDGGISPS